MVLWKEPCPCMGRANSRKVVCNYEAYEYSLGAMDKTHYSVGKHYEIIDIKGLLYIRYSERNQTTYEEYARTIKKYNGRKVSNTK